MSDRGVAFVTGGASGTGWRLRRPCSAMAGDCRSGACPASAPLEPVPANATKCVVMDVTNEASVIAGLNGREAGFGPVRRLVNSAGIGCDIPFFDTELAPQNIRVNAIAPGPVETPLVQALQTDKTRAEWISEVPQRRYASQDEISGAALFLLDHSKAGFVTGHVLNVDGGFAAGGYLPVRA